MAAWRLKQPSPSWARLNRVVSAFCSANYTTITLGAGGNSSLQVHHAGIGRQPLSDIQPLALVMTVLSLVAFWVTSGVGTGCARLRTQWRVRPRKVHR